MLSSTYGIMQGPGMHWLLEILQQQAECMVLHLQDHDRQAVLLRLPKGFKKCSGSFSADALSDLLCTCCYHVSPQVIKHI